MSIEAVPIEPIQAENRRSLIWIMFVSAVLLRLAFVFLTPAWQAPDEYAHFWVSEQIVLTGEYPSGDNTWPSYEAYQPPLYYFVGALVVAPFDLPVTFTLDAVTPTAPLIVLRLVSVLIFAATFWFAFGFFRRIIELTPAERFWCLAFVSFLPTYVGNSAAVSNDGLAVFFSAMACFVLWRPVWNDRTAVATGLLAGLALLSKWNAVILIPIVIWRMWMISSGDSRRFARYGLLAALGWLIPALILLGRNYVDYGDPLSLSPGAVRGFGLTFGNLWRAARNLTWSFWLAFGDDYKTAPAPVVYLLTALPLMLAALLGWWRALPVRGDLFRSILFACLAGVVASLSYTLSFPPGEATSWGKNLFVILPFAAILAVTGWSRLDRRRPWLIPSLATLLMLTGSLWGLWRLWSKYDG